MAAVRCASGSAAVYGGRRAKVFNLRLNTSDAICLPHAAREEKRGESSRSQENQAGNSILAAAFSRTGNYLALTDDQKLLHLYHCQDDHWNLLSSRSVVRRCVAVTFTQDGSTVLVADKSGDVYCFTTLEPDSPGRLLMGHLSMLLDMVLINEDRYLATCDRDEKIRISHYPNAYNIHSYCLGHTDFVTRLLYVQDQKLIISGSGDGTIRVWSLETKLLHTVNSENDAQGEGATGHHSADPAAVRSLTFDPLHRVLAVISDRSHRVYLFRLTTDAGVKLSPCQTLHMEAELCDACFDEESILWVLQLAEGANLAMYMFPEGQSQLVEVPAGVHYNIRKTINDDWRFFKDSRNASSLHGTLTKAKIDNMADYLEKKKKKMMLLDKKATEDVQHSKRPRLKEPSSESP